MAKVDTRRAPSSRGRAGGAPPAWAAVHAHGDGRFCALQPFRGIVSTTPVAAYPNGPDPGKIRCVKNHSKSDFIRAQPPELSAAEIVEKAKAEGIDLSAQLVYVVRSVARRKSPRRGPSLRLAASSRSGRSSPGPSATLDGRSAPALSRQFCALVTDIGLLHAEELLDAFRTEVASIDLG